VAEITLLGTVREAATPILRLHRTSTNAMAAILVMVCLLSEFVEGNEDARSDPRLTGLRCTTEAP
jgi:hypothetical protein